MPEPSGPEAQSIPRRLWKLALPVIGLNVLNAGIILGLMTAPIMTSIAEDALKAHPDAKLLAFVHAETSTGVRSDAEQLVELAHRHGCLAIVDAVTSLAGIPLEIDEWAIDLRGW